MSTEQQAALDALKRAVAEFTAANQQREELIVEAGEARVPRARVEETSGLSRSTIWKLWKAAGVPPLPAGTSHLQLSDKQREILARLGDAADRCQRAEEDYAENLLNCGRVGVRQTLVADATGYGRERIRQKWREAGIKPGGGKS